MKQLLNGGTIIDSAVAGGNTPPFSADRNNTAGTLADLYDTPVAASGVLSNFFVRMNSISSSNRSFIFSNITSTNTVTLTIIAGQTSVSDDSSTLAVTAGDLLRVTVPLHESAPVPAQYSCKFTGTNANEAVMAGGTFREVSLPTAAGTIFFNPAVQGNIGISTESQAYLYIPTPVTIKSFYTVIWDTNTGSPDTSEGTGTRNFSLYKNGVEVVASKLAFGTNDHTLSATGLSISLAIGDTLTVANTVTGAVGASKLVQWGIMYNPTTDGESIVAGVAESALSNTQNVTQYAWMAGNGGNGSNNFDATENNRLLSPSVTFMLKNLRVDLQTAPGASQSRTFTVRKNNAPGNETVTISGSNTTVSDSVNIDTFSAHDTFDISHLVVSAAPATSNTSRWSAVMYKVGGANISNFFLVL